MLNALKGLNITVVLRFVWFAAFLFVFSCSEKKPEGVLTKKEMVKVLMEVYLAEDKVSRLSLKPDSSKKVFAVFKDKVFDKVAVKDSLFDASFDYYMNRPKDMETIYTALVDSLNLREQRSSFSKE